MSKNISSNDLSASKQQKGQMFYKRLTSSPAYGILFAVGVGLVAAAGVETFTGQKTQPIARWRWLFQLAHDSMGTYGPTILIGFIGTLMICWAVIGTNKQIDRN